MRSVTIIDRQAIESSPATTLADLLAAQGGVRIQRRGAPGVQADVGIRGSNFEQTLVLLDGIPIHSPQTGHNNLNVPVSLPQIQRIEIVKGPDALQYGGNTTGGVINIITRHPDNSQAGIDLRLGSHDTRQISVYGGLGGRGLSQLLSVGIAHVGTERAGQPTDADTRELLYTGQTRPGSMSIHWGAGASRKAYGAWGFYSDVFPDERERIRTRMAWVGMRATPGAWQLATDVYWRGYKDWFMTRIGAGQFINQHLTTVYGLKGSAQRADTSGTTALGGSLRHATIDSTALANHKRDQAAVWVMRRQQLARNWRLDIGLNRVQYTGHEPYWLPSAAVSWGFNPGWHAYASVARSARVPSYTEMFINTPANRGNPKLQPERADALELGVAGHPGSHQWKGALFERRSDTLIDWMQAPGDTAKQAASFSGYRVKGMAISWQWWAQVPGVDMLGLDWKRLDVSLDSHHQPVAYARQVPSRVLRLRWRTQLGRRWRLALSARQPRYRHQRTATLVAARLAWHGKHWALALSASNLLNEKLIETGFSPIVGRWYELTINVPLRK